MALASIRGYLLYKSSYGQNNIFGKFVTNGIARSHFESQQKNFQTKIVTTAWVHSEQAKPSQAKTAPIPCPIPSFLIMSFIAYLAFAKKKKKKKKRSMDF
jgi:hypothetical protein